MFKGQSTYEAYEQYLAAGLCKWHLKELSEEIAVTDRHELQRKVLLYIRLRILDPLLFGKPFVFDRMKTLVSRSGFFKSNRTADAELVGQNSWHQSILLLDSIVVFTICEFCKVCCCGCLFLTSQETKSSHPEADFIKKLLINKNVTESDISHFNPLLQCNFKGFEPGLIKFCYVVALLFVRNITVRMKLNQALSELSVEFQNISKESEKWIEIGSDAYKKQNHDESIEAFTCALKYNPYCVPALSQRAQVYFEMGNLKQAELDSYVALMIDPQQSLAYIILSSSLIKQHSISEGQKVAHYGLLTCCQIDCQEYKKLVELGKQTINRHIKEDKDSSKETNIYAAGSTPKTEESIKNMDPPDLEDPDSENEEENHPSIKNSVEVTSHPPALDDNKFSLEKTEDITSPPALENGHASTVCLTESACATLISPENGHASTVCLTESACATLISPIKEEKTDDLIHAEGDKKEPSQVKSPEKSSSSLTVDNIERARTTVQGINLKQEITEMTKEKTDGLKCTNCNKNKLSSGKRSRKISSNLAVDNIDRTRSTLGNINLKQELTKVGNIDGTRSTLENINLKQELTKVDNKNETRSTLENINLKQELTKVDNIDGTKTTPENINLKQEVTKITKKKTDGLKYTNSKKYKVLSSGKRSRKYPSNLTVHNIERARTTVENINLKQEITEITKEKTDGFKYTNCEKNELPSEKRSRKNSSNLTAGFTFTFEGDKTTAKNFSFFTELSVEEKKQKHKELFLSLKEGSQTLLDGCGQSAVRHFDAALGIIKDFPSVCQFEEWELVCIKYAYGFAYCTSGGYEDLQRSIAVFKEIIDDYSSVSFPAVYYGIGLSFYKLHRFKDALSYLKIVGDILLKGIHFKVYAWPGLRSIINETKFDQLKYLVENLIKDCEVPPPPDAICRLNECSYQPSIYFSDPDFKGFYTLQCSDHCSLQYHPHCWKVLRSYKQYTDKEFLDQNCLTPDCDGFVIKVESINKEGILEKMFGSAQAKKPAKQKKPKLSKKIDLKEEKKKKRQNSRDIEADKNRGLLEDSSVSPSEMSESPTNDSTIKENCTLKSESENVTSDLPKEPNKSFDNYIPLSVHAEPYIMIKKEKVITESTDKNAPKVKDVKKAKDNTFTFEEFCMKSGTDSESKEPIFAQQKNQCIIQDQWSTYDDINIHPVVLSYMENTGSNDETSNQIIEQEDTFDEINDLEAIKNNLYNYMEDFLNRNGPLSIKDSRLIDELETFPTEANIVIAKYGGIANFLKEDMEYRFGIVDNLFICSRNDLADAYKLSRSSGIIGSDNLDLLEEFETQNLEIKTCNGGSETSLNPEAKEYTPSNSSSSHNSMTSFTEECFVESKTEMASRPSSSLITAISKLREPISVDNNFKNDAQTADFVVAPHRRNSPTNLIPHSLIESFQPKEITSNDGMDLSEKCIEGVNLYFREEMSSQRAYIDSCIRPYGIVHILEKVDQNLQTDEVQFEDESKTKEELLKLKEVIDALTIEKRELFVQKTLAETKLESELDSATKRKKQAAIEIANLKRELEDASQNLESQKNEFKSKQLIIEKENSILVETLKKSTEENVQLNKEVTNIRLRMESIMESLKKFEESMQCVESENKLLKKTLDQQTAKQSEVVKNFESEKLQFTRRAKDAELRYLQMKKELVFQKIDSKTYEAAQNMKSLDNFFKSPLSSSVAVLFKTSLEALNTQIQNCISKLAEIRLNFQSRIDEQINAVNNNTSLETLTPVEVNTLPEIPSLENILKASNPGDKQNQMQNAQMINLWNSTCNFPSNQTDTTNGVFHSNPMFAPPQTTSFLPYQTVPNTMVKQSTQTTKPEPKKTKLPPGIKNVNVPASELSDCQVKDDKAKVFNSNSVLSSESSASSIISNDPSVACSSQSSQVDNKKPEVSSTSQTLEKPIVHAASKASLASSSSTIDVDLSSNCDNSTLELGYNVKKNESSKSNPLPVAPVKPKGTYEKLLQKLKSKYPSYDVDSLMQYVKRFREKRKGGLSGLTIDIIISNVSDLIESSKPATTTQTEKVAVPSNSNPKPSKTLKIKKITVDPKEEKPQKQPPQKTCPWGRTDNDSKNNWSGNNALGEECIICYSEMTHATAYKVDCGHSFHFHCIRTWLNKKSDCPICRVHLLLPEDYPALS